MPSKLMPGTPSMFGGSRMPCQWIEVSWPWIEFGGSALETYRLTVSPSRQRRIGAGIDPLTVIAVRVLPVKFIGVSPMVRRKSVPESTSVWPGDLSAQDGLDHKPRPATAPPTASPWTKRRRDKPAPKPEDSVDIKDSNSASRWRRARTRAEKSMAYGRRTRAHIAADRNMEHAPDKRSEEHTSELQSLMRTSYAVFCLKKKKTKK